GRVLVAPADDLGADLRPVVLEPAVELLHEVVRVREADIDEEQLLALEAVQSRRHPARAHLRRVALGIQDPDLRHGRPDPNSAPTPGGRSDWRAGSGCRRPAPARAARRGRRRAWRGTAPRRPRGTRGA